MSRSCRSGRPAREPLRFWARMQSQGKRDQLDDELAGGADPRASAELSERASQLRSEPVRTRLANTLVDPFRAPRMALDERAADGRQLRRAA